MKTHAVIILALYAFHCVNSSPCAKRLTVVSAVASAQQVGNEAPHAIDNNLGTRWSGEGIGAYITLDLGLQQSICTVS